MTYHFRIVENPDFEFEDIIPEFLELYKNKDVLCDDIRKKFKLNTNEFDKVRREVINRGLCSDRKNLKDNNPRYYYFSESYNRWIISKQIDGAKKYFFSCVTEEDAIKLRDELIKYGWDKSKVDKDKVLGK